MNHFAGMNAATMSSPKAPARAGDNDADAAPQAHQDEPVKSMANGTASDSISGEQCHQLSNLRRVWD